MRHLTDLHAIHTELWQQLTAAVSSKDHPWRTPVLATINGHLADARTVVLREVDAREPHFLIYTDERAAKVPQLLSHPVGTLVMWSAEIGWQLRCRVHLSLEMTGLAASSRWARIKLTPAAQDYLSPLPPGAPLDAEAAPTHDAVARDYFSVINAKVLAIDWLELHEQGHRRARFEGTSARWLQP
ncbi:MAG: pyridoxamine 5'-phosphate oxidase [Burkholderiaceae bacterium]|nr:pyridoxamine 5'-phosphate oxidase [Burkholderiaceae bacterium]